MEQKNFEEPFVFMNKPYYNGSQLAQALIENWDIGMSVLRRGDLKGFEKEADRIWEGEEDETSVFQKSIHQLDSSLPGIPFMNREEQKAEVIPYEKLGEILATIEKKDPDYDMFRNAAENQVFSTYNPKFKDLERITIQGVNKEDPAEIRKILVERLQGNKYFRYQDTVYKNDSELEEKIREVLEAGDRETFLFFRELYESDEYKKTFQIWGQETDIAKGNQNYETLHQKWCQLNNLMERMEGKEWSGIPMYNGIFRVKRPTVYYIWNWFDFFSEQGSDSAKSFLKNAQNNYNKSIEEKEERITEGSYIREFLDWVERAIFDSGKGKPIQQYKVWIKATEVIDSEKENIELLRNAVNQLEDVLEYHQQKQSIEKLNTLNDIGKEYLIDVELFLAKQSSADVINALLNEAKKNEESTGIAFLELVCATKFFLKKKDLTHRNNYRIGEDLADEYYLKRVDSFAKETAATLEQLGQKSNIYDNEWRELAKVLGKEKGARCYEKMEAFSREQKKIYEPMEKQGKKFTKYNPSNLLLTPKWYGKKYKRFNTTYNDYIVEYSGIQKKYKKTVSTYTDKLEKLQQAVACCNNAEYGKLLENYKNSYEAFQQEYENAKNAIYSLSHRAQEIYDGAGILLEKVKKKEESLEKRKPIIIRRPKEKSPKKKRSKKISKKRRIKKTIVALLLIGFGVFFYLRYMTSTYYGTPFYLGKLFPYEEYQIADGATRIAPNTFRGVDRLVSIEIPDTVEEIGESAFENCVSLEEMKLPDSVLRVGDGAFKNCISLKKFQFGKGMQSGENYGYRIFENCARLKRIEYPDNMQGTVIDTIVKNCSSLNIREEETQLYLGNVYSELYVNGVNGVPLLENEVQLKNALRNRQFSYGTEKTSVTVSYDNNEKLKNISLGEEEESETGRKTTYSCDYQTDIGIFHLSGVLEQEMYEEGDVAAPLSVSVSCDGMEILIDAIMEPEADGDYPLLRKLLDGKTVYIEKQESDIVLAEKQLVINEASVAQVFDEEQESNVYTISFDVELDKNMGSYMLSGELVLLEKKGTDGEVILKDSKFLGTNLLGTYDGFSINRQYDGYYSAMSDETGGCIIIYDGNAMGKGTWIEPYRGSSACYAMKVDWENDCLNIIKNGDIKKDSHKKTSNDVAAMPQEYAELIGVWKGKTTYHIARSYDAYHTVSAKKYILPFDTDVRAVFEYGEAPYIALEKVEYDPESKHLEFSRVRDLSEKTYFADIEGYLNDSGTVISGEVYGIPFQFVKQKTEDE